MHAGTGWVHHHDIGATMGAVKILVQKTGHISRIKFGVTDTVGFRIAPRIFDSGFYVFNTNYFGCMSGQEQGNAARSCVKVVHQFIPLQGTPIQGQTIQSQGLPGVGLKKRSGGDAKSQTVQGFGQPVLALMHLYFKAFQTIIGLGIDSIEPLIYLGQLGPQGLQVWKQDLGFIL